jgi:hypothetical protein
MISHVGRKIRKSGKRLLKASRVAGRKIAQGTGYARKLIGKVDSFTGGMATRTLKSNPYGQVALRTLSATENAGKMMRHPSSAIKEKALTTALNR